MARVSLRLLGVDVVIDFSGLSDDEVEAFVRAWSRCGATRGDGSPGDPAGDSDGGGDGGTGGPTVVRIRAEVDAAGRRPGGADPRSEIVAPDYRSLADQLSGLVTREAIGARRSDLLMFHAGAVADPRTGAVIAFVGPSGRGKTTASIALGSVFGYLTDETVAVADDLSVLPYPKPLSVKLPEPERWKEQVSPDDLGLVVPPGLPLRLVALVLLDRQPAGAASVRSVPLVEVLPELVPQVSYLAARPRALHRLRDVVDACGGLRVVTYSEAADLAAVFSGLFEAQTGRSPGPRYLSVVDDSLDEGENLVVLRDRTVSVLTGIAPAIMDSAATLPRTLDELVAAVVAEHGAPPEGSAEHLVEEVLQQLVEGGFLTVEPA